MLDDPGLRQLRQRITVRFHLRSLDRGETDLYVHWRMQVAGANGRPTFTPWALRRVYGYSRGIPRLINAVCDTALLAGFVEGVDELTARHVRRAVRELEGRPT
jgi:general secretion pathway protein A